MRVQRLLQNNPVQGLFQKCLQDCFQKCYPRVLNNAPKGLTPGMVSNQRKSTPNTSWTSSSVGSKSTSSHFKVWSEICSIGSKMSPRKIVQDVGPKFHFMFSPSDFSVVPIGSPIVLSNKLLQTWSQYNFSCRYLNRPFMLLNRSILWVAWHLVYDNIVKTKSWWFKRDWSNSWITMLCSSMNSSVTSAQTSL